MRPEDRNTTDNCLAYREVSAPEYAATAARTFERTWISKNHLMLSGPCPRCSCFMEVQLVSEVFKTPGAWAAGPEPFICEGADRPHPGSPPGETGCGASWLYAVPGSHE